MKSQPPRYINVEQSFLRKIKSGWYATDRSGGLLDGPFANRERCLARISQRAAWVTSSTARERA